MLLGQFIKDTDERVAKDKEHYDEMCEDVDKLFREADDFRQKTKASAKNLNMFSIHSGIEALAIEIRERYDEDVVDADHEYIDMIVANILGCLPFSTKEIQVGLNMLKDDESYRKN